MIYTANYCFSLKKNPGVKAWLPKWRGGGVQEVIRWTDLFYKKVEIDKGVFAHELQINWQFFWASLWFLADTGLCACTRTHGRATDLDLSHNSSYLKSFHLNIYAIPMILVAGARIHSYEFRKSRSESFLQRGSDLTKFTKYLNIPAAIIDPATTEATQRIKHI